jgi:ABC-type nitrate/sulfonate/bicarbonate transport system substrate-binding protein
MRFILAILYVHFFALCLSSLGWAAEPLTKLLFAYGATSNNATPLWVAKDHGLFRKHGLDADLVFIIAGRAAQAMLAGQVRVGLIGATHVTNVVTAGGDLTMILGLQNRLDFLFIARPSVKRADDLKGKKVAIGTPSGSAALATYVALDHLGLVPKRDNVVLLQLGDVPERVAALRAGNVEAASLSPELGPLLTAEGYRVLLDIGKENIPFQSAGLVISRALMKSEPELVENIAKAIVEAVAFIHNPSNKTAVEKTIDKFLRLGKPDRIEKAYQDLRQVLPRKPCPTLEGVATVLKLMAQHGLNPKASQLKPENVVDMNVCKKLDESGFMDRLY